MAIQNTLNEEETNLVNTLINSGITDEKELESNLFEFREFKNKQQQEIKQAIPAEEQGTPGLEGFAAGTFKGLLSTVTGMSELGQKLLDPTRWFSKKHREREVAKIPEELTTPVGTAEKIGFGAEQIGEFFVPATKVAKPLKAATKGSSWLTKLLTTMGVEGTIGGGVSALQEGEIGTEQLIDGAISAAAGGTAILLSAPVKAIGVGIKKLGVKVLQSTVKTPIAALKEYAKKYTSLGDEMMKLLKTGALKVDDTAHVLKQSDDVLETFGKSYDDIFKQKEITMSADDVFDGIKKGFDDLPTGLVEEELKTLDDIQKIVTGKKERLAGGMFDGFQLNKIKRSLANKGYAGIQDTPAKEMYRDASKFIREFIESKDNTGTIRDLNKSWKLWSDIQEGAVNKLAGESSVTLSAPIAAVGKVTGEVADMLKLTTGNISKILSWVGAGVEGLSSVQIKAIKSLGQFITDMDKAEQPEGGEEQ